MECVTIWTAGTWEGSRPCCWFVSSNKLVDPPSISVDCSAESLHSGMLTNWLGTMILDFLRSWHRNQAQGVWGYLPFHGTFRMASLYHQPYLYCRWGQTSRLPVSHSFDLYLLCLFISIKLTRRQYNTFQFRKLWFLQYTKPKLK